MSDNTTPTLSVIQLQTLNRLLAYSAMYEISIQFWPEQTAVFIAKAGEDFAYFGGDFDFAISKSLQYLNRIQP